MRAWCGIGWASMLGDLSTADRIAFLHDVARERLVPCFHEVVDGRLWRVAEGDVQHVKGPKADAIVRAVAEAPGGEVPFELAEDFPDIALPGATDADLELPYAPEGVWHVTDVAALHEVLSPVMNDVGDEEPADRAIWRGYVRKLLDALDLCARDLFAFNSVTAWD